MPEQPPLQPVQYPVQLPSQPPEQPPLQSPEHELLQDPVQLPVHAVCDACKDADGKFNKATNDNNGNAFFAEFLKKISSVHSYRFIYCLSY